MGNITSHTGQISGSRFEGLRTEPTAIRAQPKQVAPQVKVLPDVESRQRLRHTNNGDILQSGGTLSGRPQVPYRNALSKPYLPAQRYSFHKSDVRSVAAQNRQYASSQNIHNPQVKSYKSEPDLRLPSAIDHEMTEKRPKKKYKAPPPPKRNREEKPQENWDLDGSDDYPPRRVRLFKTRVETKKESSQLGVCDHVTSENNSDIIEEKIQAKQIATSYGRPNRLSLPEFNLMESIDFKNELKHATDRLKHQSQTPLMDTSTNTNKNLIIENNNNKLFDQHPHEGSIIPSPMERGNSAEFDKRCIRGEPSGKESSTPEMSPVLRPEAQKPRAFYFGMDREDSDVSSVCQVDEEDEQSTIALRLRPVLPRKPPQIPHFSPAAAWKLLDSRSQDSGISGDARPPLISSSWTPQQDLGDDSSLEEVRRELPKSLPRHRPHIFSLSLPRDLQPAPFTTLSSSKTGVSSLRRLKRSVSGVLNNLASRRDTTEQPRGFSRDQDDANWFFSRSAPNSINENSPDVSAEAPYNSHISTTARLMYLPENTSNKMYSSSTFDKCQQLSSAFSKSCEELKMPESLRDDPKSVLESSWPKEEPSKKHRKFTFQSTVRQIERRRMAEKLSKEAEKKERQRLRELEAMRQVEEEFQKKRAKEKANIRQQLRLYAMDENQWTSLPFELNDVKLEERQEPEGAISSSASSPTPVYKYDDAYKNTRTLEAKKTTHPTQELSEYRQIQRDYKDYRGSTTKFGGESRSFRQTTVHPEVTCNMPNAKVSNHERGNYRKDFAYGIKSSKSIDSNPSEDSPKFYRNKFSPITRF